MIGGNSTTASPAECSCYGCEIQRLRDGVHPPDRSAELCSPPGACTTHGRCWTHSSWVDVAACDPPGACATGSCCCAHDALEVAGPPA